MDLEQRTDELEKKSQHTAAWIWIVEQNTLKCSIYPNQAWKR
jgi:hypothetical protein